MIRGYFRELGGRRRPYVRAELAVPSASDRTVDVRLLVDTGADRTILSSQDLERLGLDLNALPPANPSRGVGGQLTEARRLDAVVTMGDFQTAHPITVLLPTNPSLRITSLLGRDLIQQFALYVDDRNGLVLLLDPQEADALRPHLPGATP